MHQPPRNDTVHLLIMTSLYSHYELNAGWIPTWVRCLFTVGDVESSVKGLPAFVQTFPTGLICPTAGMVIVEKKH
jgi:hypothetical protein